MARDDWDDEAYRDWVRERLSAHADDLPADVRERLVGRLRFVRGDVTDPAGLRSALARVDGEPVVYLALPHTLRRQLDHGLSTLTSWQPTA